MSSNKKNLQTYFPTYAWQANNSKMMERIESAMVNRIAFVLPLFGFDFVSSGNSHNEESGNKIKQKNVIKN